MSSEEELNEILAKAKPEDLRAPSSEGNREAVIEGYEELLTVIQQAKTDYPHLTTELNRLERQAKTTIDGIKGQPDAWTQGDLINAFVGWAKDFVRLHPAKKEDIYKPIPRPGQKV